MVRMCARITYKHKTIYTRKNSWLVFIFFSFAKLNKNPSLRPVMIPGLVGSPLAKTRKCEQEDLTQNPGCRIQDKERNTDPKEPVLHLRTNIYIHTEEYNEGRCQDLSRKISRCREMTAWINVSSITNWKEPHNIKVNNQIK